MNPIYPKKEIIIHREITETHTMENFLSNRLGGAVRSL